MPEPDNLTHCTIIRAESDPNFHYLDIHSSEGPDEIYILGRSDLLRLQAQVNAAVQGITITADPDSACFMCRRGNTTHRRHHA
jgi:hypothetical protein